MGQLSRCPFGEHDHPPAETYCAVVNLQLPPRWAGPAPRVDRAVDESVDRAVARAVDRAVARADALADALVRPAERRAAFVALPSGDRAPIPAGVEITVGRESEIAAIAEALAPFDAVGRRQCFVTVDPTGGSVTVREPVPASTNGTWVAPDSEPLAAGERRVVPLPALLRLGRHLAVTVESPGPAQRIATGEGASA